MTPDQDSRLNELEAFVGRYSRDELTATVYWDDFIAIARPLEEAASEDDADPELRERYLAVLAVADKEDYVAPKQGQ